MAGTIPIKKLLTASVAVGAIAFSVWFLLRTSSQKVEPLAMDASRGLGQRAGEEVAQLIGHTGKVAVIEMNIQPGQAPTAAATLDEFRNILKKHDISVVRSVKLSGGLTALVMGGGMISREEYLKLVQDSPPVDAVVTFAKLPAIPESELHQFQIDHPPLVVVDIFGMLTGPILPSLVEQKTVALAVGTLSAPEIEQHAHDTEIFDRYYKVMRISGK